MRKGIAFGEFLSLSISAHVSLISGCLSLINALTSRLNAFEFAFTSLAVCGKTLLFQKY